jgi:O-antigen/teichoic acid export membrane protein
MSQLLPPTAVRKRGLKGSIIADLSRGSHSSLSLLMLKGLNAALTAVSNFILVYVLVRTIGLPSYAVIAGLLAIAALVVQSDLGITGLTFFKLRSHYLRETNKREASQDDQALVITIVSIYVAIAAIAVAILGLALIAGIVPAAPHGVACLLVFAGAVCALPRMPLRVAINARDGFVWTEGVDLGRRIALLGVTLAMLLGVSFVSYGALSLFMWVMSIVALIWLARPHGFTLQSGAFRRGLLLLRSEFRGVRATVLLSSAEFIISIFPYYLLSATGDVSAIVAFDMFYKVTRFAAMSYLIGAETVLPHQTRAVHNENASGFGRATATGFMLGLLPMTLGIFAVSMFGEKMFGVILNHSGRVTPTMRIAICAMLVFMLIQTSCAIVLIGVGKFEALARRAAITLAGMVLISALMILFHWSVDAFIVAYVAVYGGGALLYAECLYSLNRSLRDQNAQTSKVET